MGWCCRVYFLHLGKCNMMGQLLDLCSTVYSDGGSIKLPCVFIMICTWFSKVKIVVVACCSEFEWIAVWVCDMIWKGEA